MPQRKKQDLSHILQYQSIQNWMQSLSQNAISRGKPLTDNAKRHREGKIKEYTNNGEINPDDLIEEAKQDIKQTGKRLQQYFEQKLKEGASWNSCITAVALIRGFYTHNDIVFPKNMKLAKPRVSAVKKLDTKTPIYEYNELTDETIFKHGTVQHFFDNLILRDQTVALCLFSSGMDVSDLFNLNMDFVNDPYGRVSNVKRYFVHGNRLKDGVEFKTFFSTEATEYIRRYVEQERCGAKKDDPLFVRENGERLEPKHMSVNFRNAAKKMGLITGNDVSNPFRPKRFRSLFRTACGMANVDSGFTMSFMGHKSTISNSYLEKPDSLFLREYIKIEPWVTVYGLDKSQMAVVAENVVEMKKEIDRLQEGHVGVDQKKLQRVIELLPSIETYEENMKTLSQLLKDKELISVHDPKIEDILRSKGIRVNTEE